MPDSHFQLASFIKKRENFFDINPLRGNLKSKLFWAVFLSLVGLFCVVFGYFFFSGKLYSNADSYNNGIVKFTTKLKIGKTTSTLMTGRMIGVIKWQEVVQNGQHGKVQVWSTSLSDGALSSPGFVQGDLDNAANGTLVFKDPGDQQYSWYELSVVDPVLGMAIMKGWCDRNSTFIYPPNSERTLEIRCTCNPYLPANQPAGCTQSPTPTPTPTRTPTKTPTRTPTRTPTATPRLLNATISINPVAAKPSKVKANRVDEITTNSAQTYEAVVNSSWQARFSSLPTGRYKFYVCDGGPTNTNLVGGCTAGNNMGSKTIYVLSGEINNASIRYGVWQ